MAKKDDNQAKKPVPRSDDLQRLERDLYARQESPEIKKRSEQLAHLGHVESSDELVPTELQEKERAFKDIYPKLVHRRRVLFLINGIGLALFLIFTVVVLGTWWYRLGKQVSDNQVALEIVGPAEVTSGQEVTYRIIYGNNSLTEWQNVEVLFEPPRGFRVEETEPAMDTRDKQYAAKIGSLAPQQQGVMRVRGHLIGEQNAAALSKAQIILTPTNFPAGSFSKTVDFATAITSFSLELAVEASRDVAPGERVLMPIQIRNLGDKPLNGAYVKVKGSEGIKFAVEDPNFSPGFSVPQSRWNMPPIPPLETITRTLVAYIDGPPGGQLVVEIEAGIEENGQEFVQRTVQSVFHISASELTVEQVYQGSTQDITVGPGERVEGLVRYRNSGNVGLKDAIVTVQFEGRGLDPASLRLPKGAYDLRNRRISWSPATVPELHLLQPQQEGELPFSFTISAVEGFPTTGDHVKNFTLITTARVDSPDLPAPVGQARQVVSDRFVMSVETKLSLQAEVLYDDGRIGLKSQGPQPPQVGHETSYTVRFRLGSLLNDVGEVRLQAVIPDGVTYTSKQYRTAGEFDFNHRTGEITWTIPLLNGGTGRLRPPEELHVQVSVLPPENKEGAGILLMRDVKVEGIDQFTETVVRDTYDRELATPSVRSASGT